MIDKVVESLGVLVIGGGLMLWDKIKAWRHPGYKPKDVGISKADPPGPIIWHGVAGYFIESVPSTLPGSKEYEEVRRAVIDYPQTREGAEAFLHAMAKEKNGSWVSTTVVGVADDNADRAMREEAIKLMSPLEEVNLYSKPEDSEQEDDCAEERVATEADASWICVEFIGDRIGFLEPVLAAEIVLAKEEESTRMISFVLEITGTSEKDRGVDIGILCWKAETRAIEEEDQEEAA